jgi:hypothetical protein
VEADSLRADHNAPDLFASNISSGRPIRHPISGDVSYGRFAFVMQNDDIATTQLALDRQIEKASSGAALSIGSRMPIDQLDQTAAEASHGSACPCSTTRGGKGRRMRRSSNFKSPSSAATSLAVIRISHSGNNICNPHPNLSVASPGRFN